MSDPVGSRPAAGARGPSWRRRLALKAYLWPGLVLAVTLGAAVAELRRQGRSWWCACGRPDLWWGDIHSPHNSQHLFDPFSFTHVLHGILLCGALAWALPRLAPAWRFCVAVALEAAWEVFENTDLVIDRYRAATASLGYRGDTVANSLGDILSCALGFLIARRLGLWRSAVLFVVTEVTLLFWIRDSLLLELLMLLHPIDAIKGWQLGQ
jgi:hypothetical protein